jgi:polynucleotide 5'-hydroxyl-kinase GRC3/NOL9
VAKKNALAEENTEKVMGLDPTWEKAFAAAAEARVIFFLGQSDVGKTTMLLALANFLHSQDYSVGVVDADIGQSSLGPPTTIGLGVLRKPVQRLEEVPLVALSFVGAITPVGHLLPTVGSTASLVQKALHLGIEKILIDTSGLVTGDLGRVLKQQKIELVAPDLIYCLQIERECEGILRAYRHTKRPRVERVQPSLARRMRSPEERRAYREERFKRYFATAERRELCLSNLNLSGSSLFAGEALDCGTQKSLTTATHIPIVWGEIISAEEAALVTPYELAAEQVQRLKAILGKRWISVYSLHSLKNMLLGLLGENGAVIGLGILRYIDFQRGVITLSTPVRDTPVRGLQFSRFQYT